MTKQNVPSRIVGLSLIALLGATCSTGALAQAGATNTGSDEAAIGREIVVTGTAIRGVAPVGSATVNIGRDAIVQTGIRDAAGIVSQLSQGSSLGTSQNSNGGRQQGVNLRGLGNNATLLLFDGHRWVPQGVTSQVSDPSVIPFAALERVEVVTDGASAIYGSDAVAGVVNYILRKDYNGAEVSARYTDTLYKQYNFEGVAGHSWEGGNVLLAGSVQTRDRVKRNVRDYLRFDLRPYGGNDNRLVGTTVYPGLTPALLVGTTVYGLPAGLNGRVPTAAEVLALKGQPALYDPADMFDYFASRQQYTALLRVRQEIGEDVELTWTSNFNRRQNAARAEEGGAMARLGITIAPTSPYYIAGLSTGNHTLVYNLSLNFADRELEQRNKEDTWNSTIDVKAGLFGDFRLSSYATIGKTSGCNVCQPQVNSTIAGVITTARPSFNPYLSGPQANAEDLIAGFLQEAWIRMIDTAHKVDGTLFQLPGGAVRVAVGGEYTKYDFHLVAQNKLNLTNSWQVSRNARSDRAIASLFAEAFVPLFGNDNAIPGFQRLDFNGAVRYDDYSDAGKTLNPKFGMTWKPVNDLTVRGSWGTSFRAPTMIESNPGVIGQTNRIYISNGSGDPAIPVTLLATGQSAVLDRTGTTAGLQPENATVWSLGTDFAPSFLPGFKASLTYYNVSYVDRIENLPNQSLVLSSAANRALYKNFIIVAPQPSTCVNGNYSTYNPLYIPFLTNKNAVYSPFTINDCTLTAIVNGGTQNLGNVKQDGLDFSADYRFETGLGRFTLSANFTKILNLKKSLLRNLPLFDALDTIGNQLSERGSARIGYNKDRFAANLTANYVGSFLNNATITVAGVKQPDAMVPAWTTVDGSFSYTIPENADGALAGTRFGLNVQNLTDKAPPIVLSGTNAVDGRYHNVFGRIVSFEISRKF